MHLKTAFRNSFYFLLIGGAVTANLLLQPRFANNLPLLTLLISISAIIIVAVAERIIPFLPEWNISQGDITLDFILTNVSLPVMSKIAEAILGAIFLGASLKLEKILGFHVWPRSLPILVQLPLALLISEFGFYWVHRYSHQDNWLGKKSWR